MVIFCVYVDTTVQFGFVASSLSCFHCKCYKKGLRVKGKVSLRVIGRNPCCNTSVKKRCKKGVLICVPGVRKTAPLKFPYSNKYRLLKQHFRGVVFTRSLQLR